MLAAIHAHALRLRAPRLARLLPPTAACAEPVLLVGANLRPGPLLVRFGCVDTWAAALSDTVAVALVPAGGRGPVSVQSRGFRSNSLAFGGGSSDDPPSFLRVDPANGAVGVFRDSPVVLTVSAPVDQASLSPATVRVEDGSEPLPGQIFSSPDARVVIWSPDRPMTPGVPHVVRARGLRDQRGRELPAHQSWFVCCDLLCTDLTG